MRKEFNAQKESFSAVSAALVGGDTAIFTKISAVENWLECISRLLQRGIVVHTLDQVLLNTALRHDSETIKSLTQLGAVIDRKVRIGVFLNAEKSRLAKVKKSQQSVESKAHWLIEEEGLGLVEACRKVHCRPSDYYIYRSKLKAKSYGR